jgi:LacI family transcriptional regulator
MTARYGQPKTLDPPMVSSAGKGEPMRDLEASHKATRVSLILPLEHYYARGILMGIQKAIYPHNLAASAGSAEAAEARNLPALPWVFSIHGGSPRGPALDRLFSDLRRWRPDLVIARIEEPKLAEFLKQFRVPVVEIYNDGNWNDFVSVNMDDVAVGRLAAEHFLDRGFTHFAFMGSLHYPFVKDRLDGFQARLQQSDKLKSQSVETSAARVQIFNCHSIIPNATVEYDQLDAIGDWLESLPKPVAIMAGRDSWGLLLAHAAFERGIHIPEEMAILAVDNDPALCEYCNPPLSSVNQDFARVGGEAVRVAQLLLAKARRVPKPALIAPGDIEIRLSSDILAVDDPDVAAALRYIRDNIRSGINVKTLLRAVPVNRRKLEREFRRVLGRSPQEEIHRFRLQLIKNLLSTDMSMRAVATAAGFSSAQYLSTFFQCATGTTPREFRQRRKQMAPESMPLKKP